MLWGFAQGALPLSDAVSAERKEVQVRKHSPGAGPRSRGIGQPQGGGWEPGALEPCGTEGGALWPARQFSGKPRSRRSCRCPLGITSC